MSRIWLDVFLGNIGRYIVDFIINYYYFIIPPIIAYGIFLTISSYNLKRIEKSVYVIELTIAAPSIPILGINKIPPIIFNGKVI